MPNPIKHTSQAIDNWSFDETYNQQAVEILTENAGGTALERQKTIATEKTLQAVAGFVVSGYDYVSASYNDPAFTETYVFKTGGSGGTTVATITVIYTDATKEKLVSVTKT